MPTPAVPVKSIAISVAESPSPNKCNDPLNSALPFIITPAAPLPPQIALSHIENISILASTCAYLIELSYLPFDLIVTLLESFIFKETIYVPSPKDTS